MSDQSQYEAKWNSNFCGKLTTLSPFHSALDIKSEIGQSDSTNSDDQELADAEGIQ